MLLFSILFVSVLIVGAPRQDPTLPRFEAYAVTDSFTAKPTPPDVRSTSLGRRFRTLIRHQARSGPNFAGHFTIVRWGCGSSCIMHAVVDAATGRVYGQTLQTQVGAEFRLNSSLLIADPPDSARAMSAGRTAPANCVVCGTPAAYVWRGDHFEPLGSGEHPHVFNAN
jgi:hypothetical protein